jgi:hypothetical protein
VAVDMQDRPHQCTYVAQENVVVVPPSCNDFPGIDHPDVRARMHENLFTGKHA